MHTRLCALLAFKECLYFYCSFFLGMKPTYFIADLDLCREINVKQFDKFEDRFVSNMPTVKCMFII